MRSSKKRSRSSQNRPRTLGNIVNRVFESSGPEGKVRGTPQQIIEKYQMLARDAQLSNDRVSAENFLQHAEHYTRMLAEAMREMAAEQEARQQQAQQNGGQHGGQSQRNDRQGEGRDRGERRPDFVREFREDRDPGTAEQPRVADVIDLGGDDGSILIETPEAAPRPRAEAAEAAEAASDAPGETTGEGTAAAPREERSQTRRPRGPRKPRPEGKADGVPPKEAAE
jgi:hypothetical protein